MTDSPTDWLLLGEGITESEEEKGASGRTIFQSVAMINRLIFCPDYQVLSTLGAHLKKSLDDYLAATIFILLHTCTYLNSSE